MFSNILPISLHCEVDVPTSSLQTIHQKVLPTGLENQKETNVS